MRKMRHTFRGERCASRDCVLLFSPFVHPKDGVPFAHMESLVPFDSWSPFAPASVIRCVFSLAPHHLFPASLIPASSFSLSSDLLIFGPMYAYSADLSLVLSFGHFVHSVPSSRATDFFLPLHEFMIPGFLSLISAVLSLFPTHSPAHKHLPPDSTLPAHSCTVGD